MDSNTCKKALAIAAKYMTPAKLALYTNELRREYLSSEIDRVTLSLSRKVIPVEEYKALSTTLPVLQQQLASL